MFETIPCEMVPSFGTHFRYLLALVFRLSLKVVKKSALERGLESGSNENSIWGPPRALSAGLAPARQLNFHFVVLDPPGSTFGAILGSN